MLDRAGARAPVGDPEPLLRRADGSEVPLNLATRPSVVELGLARATVTSTS